MGSCTGESVCVCVWGGGVGRGARQTAAPSSHLSADSVHAPSPLSPSFFFFFPPSLVADSRGGFCLPSLFEGFGLTVVEAASCGLPVFVSVHGGCREIIHDGVGGLHVDPNHPAAAADRIAAFFEAAAADGGATWAAASKAALARVAARYNWQTFARSLITMSRCVGGRLQWGEREIQKNRHSFSLARPPHFFFFSLLCRPFPSVYAFWSAATRLDQATAARRSYLQLIYQLILRPLMSRVPVPDEGGGGGGGGEGRAGAADGAACQGVCAVALGALADPGAVAPVAGGGAGGGSGGHVSASTSPRAGEDGK